MKLAFAIAGLVLATPRVLAGPGEVTGVSILPGPGRAEVVIDIRGSVSVSDFTLVSPSRLVLDVEPATLRTRNVLYDGVNRAGIVNIRYAQRTPDVVRVVIELESLRSYEVIQGDDAIRVSLGADRAFHAWSSLDLVPPPMASGSAAAAPVAFNPSARVIPATRSQPLPMTMLSQQPVITVNYDSAQIADVIAGFAAYSGKSIVLGTGVTGVVTARINNQPWDVAFRSILEAHGLTALEDPPGLIRVDSRAVLATRDSLEQLERVVVRVNYARAASLVPAIQAIISSKGKVVADTATNSLIITDVASRIVSDSAFVGQLDVRTPQVSIQAKLIFVNRSDIEQLGVRYDLGTNEQFFNRLVQRPDPSTAQPVDLNGDGVPDALRASDVFDQGVNIINLGGNALSAIANAEAVMPSPALQLIFSTAIGNFNLTSFVNALQQVDLADLQAEPLISTSDNTEAYILVGERTPIRQIDVSAPTSGGQNVPRATTEIVPTGIQLKVTPHVTANGQVMMKIRAENSSVQAAPADVGFTFQTQEAENQILVNNGETAVIGGLTVTQVTISKTGVPFLVDLPIIGRIFGFSNRTENRRDLLILVTPHIIEDSPAPGDRS